MQIFRFTLLRYATQETCLTLCVSHRYAGFVIARICTANSKQSPMVKFAI
ncbi:MULTISPECIES: hypothetical protein [unclassified Campylobacter]|nr:MULTISPECIES: hypothetical protein [unclassified Campylobacter]MDA3079600.1 hypothetical protein [Campylobacter sp. CS_NA2]MDA3080968.1 hypothetical protein [Campylobacter sp. CS_NA1]WBR50786.1 hypothetical protein PF026_05385 [Campylobacter sp. CS_NA3]